MRRDEPRAVVVVYNTCQNARGVWRSATGPAALVASGGPTRVATRHGARSDALRAFVAEVLSMRPNTDRSIPSPNSHG